MKAIHIKKGKIIEYAGELHDTPDIKQEVEILQFVKSFWGSIAICKIGDRFEEIPTKELQTIESIIPGDKPIEFHSIDTVEPFNFG